MINGKVFNEELKMFLHQKAIFEGEIQKLVKFEENYNLKKFFNLRKTSFWHF